MLGIARERVFLSKGVFDMFRAKNKDGQGKQPDRGDGEGLKYSKGSV